MIARARRPSGGPPGIRPAALAAALLLVLLAPAAAGAQEKTVTLRFTKDLLYSIARDNEGEMTEEIISRLKGLSPAVAEVRIIRTGGEVTLAYLVKAGGELQVPFRLTLEKMAFYRMAAAREDIDGMMRILAGAREREPLILELGYRYDEHYSIVDLTLDLRPALRARDEKRAESSPPPPKPPPAPSKAPERTPKAEPPAAKPKTQVSPAPAPEPSQKTGAVPAAEPKAKETPPPKETSALTVARLGEDPAPAVDGSGEDGAWRKARPFTLDTEGESGRVKVTARALWGGEAIYLLLRWADGNPDREHRPWIWSDERGEYIAGGELEDGLALQFSRAGRIGDCMLSGRESEADLWFWRAARTDPVGYAEDGTMTVSLQRIPKANFHLARNGRTVWFKEDRDGGTAPYGTQVAGPFEGEKVRRYVPRQPSGSAADVRAKGEWKEGTWTVEFSRALSTGDAGDVVFEAGREHYFSVAVFNGRERGGHSVSTEHALTLQ